MANLHAQYDELREDIDQALSEVLESCRFILGPNVTALEQELADYNGAKYGIGVASGTDAIMLSLAACGVGRDDEVITTPFTFVATTETIVQLGAKPVFVDIDPRTFNLDAAQVEAKITSRTKAILPVHLYGQMADMARIEQIAASHGLPVVADGAQAVGAKQNGRGVGSYGLSATLSFYPTKNLGGMGDGGMVLTNDEVFADRVRSLRFHGSGGSYAYQDVGWCSRLDEIQAAVLRVKLRKLDEWNAHRTAHALIYNQALAGGSVMAPVTMAGNQHTWHQYTIRSDRRDELKGFLAEREIDSAVFYPGALHVQPAYSKFGYQEGDFPAAEQTASEVLSLPVNPQLPDGASQRVAEAIVEFQKDSSSAG